MLILETDRLFLRQLDARDAAFIFELVNEPSWIRHIGDRGVRDLEGARAYIESGPVASYERFGFGLWLTGLKDDRSPIGICGLLKRDHLEHPDIGFAFLPRFWGRGYAFEAASAVMAHGRELGLEKILAITSPGNVASIRLLEKLGFVFQQMSASGGEADVKLFSWSRPADVNFP